MRAPAVFAALFSLLAVMLCHSWYGPDIWYHLSWGRSLTENGQFVPQMPVLMHQPVVANVYWLFQAAMYGMFSAGGIYAVSGFYFLLWMGIAGCWLALSGAARSRCFGPLLFMAFLVCAQTRFEHRPEILSYLFLSLLLVLLTGRESGKPLDGIFLFKIFLVQVVWSNCHGYFALGPLTGLALVASALWSNGAVDRARLDRALAIAGVLIAGSIVSPFHVHNWQLVLSLMDVSRGLREINHELMAPEVWPMYWPMQLFWPMWVLTTLWSAREIYRRGNSFAAILALAGAFLALQAVRNFPLYLLLGAPALGGVLLEIDRLAARTNQWVQFSLYFIPALMALGLGLGVVSGEYYLETHSLATFGIHLEVASYPIGAVDFLSRMKFNGKLFNDSYDGGYIEFFLPEAKPVGDSYFSDAPMTLEYFRAIKEPAMLQALDQRFGFDALLINLENLAVVESVWNDPKWVLAYADSHRLLYFRRASYSGRGLTLENLKLYNGENLRHWAYAFGMYTWAGLALRFNDMNLAAKVLSETEKSPYVPSTSIRYFLGLAVRNHSLPMAERALALIPKMYESNYGDIAKIDELQAQIQR